MNAIKLENATFAYQGMDENVLKSVNLKVRRGECVLLTGKSGCGKTTLIRLLNGLIPHFYLGKLNGNVFVNAQEIKEMKSYEIAESIGSVFQDPRSQFFTTNTNSEVAFGCENMQILSGEIRDRVSKTFESLNIRELRNKNIFKLSSGEKQKIALASVYAMNPQIFVLDEPSANLDAKSTKMLAGLLKRLKEEGNTIIISEHRLYYLMDIVDRIVYMEKGTLKEEWTPIEARNFSANELNNKGLRSFDLDSLSPITSETIDTNQSLPSFEVKDVSVGFFRKEILKKVSFSINYGDNAGIIGIIGKNGVGKTTLVKYLCGLLRGKRGSVKINDCPLPGKKRAKAMYFVTQNIEYQLFTESVYDELKLGKYKEKGLDKKIENVLEMLDLKEYKQTHPMALSGGQKQRVAIAAAAVNEADIVFFDEPTSGLDGKRMRRVGEIFRKLNQNGKLIFVISHDYEFLLNTCKRIIYLQNGQVKEDFILDRKSSKKLKSLLHDELQ